MLLSSVHPHLSLHVLMIPAIFCNPAYFSEDPPQFSLKETVQGFFWSLPMPQGYLSRKILPGDMATWRSAFCMEFLGDVGFPLFLKMLQNTSLRECELRLSTPNFFAPMSQSSSTLELLVDKSSFNLEPAYPMLETDRSCAKLLSWTGSVLSCLSLNPFSHW